MTMKEAGDLEPLFPDRDSDEPLGRQFTRRLRQAIESGLYEPSSRLLPRRELALRLGLARNTVTSAIEQLIAEGYLESRVGSGSFVVASIEKPAVVAEPAPRCLPATAVRFGLARTILEGYAVGIGPLRAGIPDMTTFPQAAWARITRRKLAKLRDFLDYHDSSGDPALRAAIAQHVQQFRGITTEHSRVIVVEGTQAGIRLAADVLLSEGDSALIEDPGYPFARAAFEARGIRLLPVPVDENGMDVALAPPARLAYVSPSHQFPLGSRMSLERRRALLDWAFVNDAYVIEDDYDSEYAYDAKPLPTLQSVDRHERVVYVGTFSKTLAPGLRLGYLIVPQHLLRAFATARVISTLGGVQYVQSTLADFVSEGHFARYVRRMTRSYAERRRALVELLERELPKGRFKIGLANAGLHLACIGPPAFDDMAVTNTLAKQGVYVQPLSAFCVARSDCRGFVIGYSAAPIADVLSSARELTRVIRETANSRA